MDEEVDIKAEPQAGRFSFGPFVLTARPLALMHDDTEVPLRHQALRLLLLFVRRPGRLVDHEEIRHHVWGDRYVDHTRGTHLLVREIRQALGDHPRNPRYVETLPRQGYRFLAPVGHGPAPQRWPATSILPPRRGIGMAAAVAAAAACLLLLWSGPPDDSSQPQPSAHAADAYAKAMHLIDRRTPDTLRQAEAYLADALRLDPAAADVRAALAKVARLTRDLDTAETRAREALALDPNQPRAQLELGLVLAMRDWNWAAAASHIDRAVAGDPASAEAHAADAAILTVLGRHVEALEASSRAYAADPVSALIRVDHGWFHYYARDYDTAWQACSEAEKLSAEGGAAILCQYKAASMAGNESRALRAAAALVERWRAEETRALPELERIPSSIDEFSRVRRMRIERLLEANQAAPEAFATAYAEVGDLAAALEMLEEAYESRSAGLPLALRDPVFEPLRGEHRFRQLVAQTVAGT